MKRRHPLILVAVLVAFVGISRNALAQFAVLDASNLIQTTTTAIKAAQTVANLLQQIELMKSQIQNQLQTLRSIDPSTVTGVKQLLGAGQSTFQAIEDDASVIKYNLADVNRGFAKLFPKNQTQWKGVQYSDFNGLYDGWNGEITSSAMAASRAQAALVTLDANNQAILTILENSKSATGEVRQLQLVNQQLGLIHGELGSLVQNLTTMSRVLSNWAASSAGESMMARERSHRRLDGYTAKGKPSRVLPRLP